MCCKSGRRSWQCDLKVLAYLLSMCAWSPYRGVDSLRETWNQWSGGARPSVFRQNADDGQGQLGGQQSCSGVAGGRPARGSPRGSPRVAQGVAHRSPLKRLARDRPEGCPQGWSGGRQSPRGRPESLDLRVGHVGQRQVDPRVCLGQLGPELEFGKCLHSDQPSQVV